MKQTSLITILFTMFFGFSKAQMVESTSYNLLLKTLLSHSVTEISVQDAAKQSHTILLDAREKNEYLVSHLKDALCVGYDKLDLSSLDKVDKSKLIIVYCSVGYRSEKVAEKLVKMGFKNVKNLYGGIFEWKNQGFEVFNQNGKTNDIHAYSKSWGIWLNKGNKIFD